MAGHPLDQARTVMTMTETDVPTCHKGHPIVGDNAKPAGRQRNGERRYRCRTCADAWKQAQIPPWKRDTLPADRTLPVQPLLDAANMPVAQLAARLGVDRLSVYRARRAGTLTLDQADRWSVALGLHPENLWPNEWGTP